MGKKGDTVTFVLYTAHKPSDAEGHANNI